MVGRPKNSFKTVPKLIRVPEHLVLQLNALGIDFRKEIIPALQASVLRHSKIAERRISDAEKAAGLSAKEILQRYRDGDRYIITTLEKHIAPNYGVLPGEVDLLWALQEHVGCQMKA